jgi:hypothetical protein
MTSGARREWTEMEVEIGIAVGVDFDIDLDFDGTGGTPALPRAAK